MKKRVFLIGLEQSLRNLLIVLFTEQEVYSIDNMEDLELASEDRDITPNIVVIGDGLASIDPSTIGAMFTCRRAYLGKNENQVGFDYCSSWPKGAEQLNDVLEEWVQEKYDDRFVQVYFPYIDINDVYDFDIYSFLKLNNRYVLYKSKGMPWSAKKVGAYSDQSNLYVHARDEEKYLNYVSKGVHGLLSDSISSPVFLQSATNLLNEVVRENNVNGKATVLSNRIISTYLTHDSESLWNKPLSKYVKDKLDILRATRFSTLCALVAITKKLANVDTFYYAAYFYKFTQLSKNSQMHNETVAALKILLAENKIILTDDVFSFYQRCDEAGVVHGQIQIELQLFQIMLQIDDILNGKACLNESLIELMTKAELDSQISETLKNMLMAA